MHFFTQTISNRESENQIFELMMKFISHDNLSITMSLIDFLKQI